MSLTKQAPRRLVVVLFLMFAATGLLHGSDILVTSDADTGNGTLRQAIQFNESVGGGNRILFSNVVSKIYLTNVLGELVITKDVNIVGSGAKLLTIDGTFTHRIFNIASAATVNISELTITNGFAGSNNNGGGIYQSAGSLTVSNCLFTGCEGWTMGGGLCVGGTAKVVNCTFVTDRGGFTGLFEAGGAFASTGSIDVINCTLEGNDARQGGGAYFGPGSRAALTNCTVVGNRAKSDEGGGLWIESSATVFVRNTILAANSANSVGQDCYGTVTSQGFNIIGQFENSSGWGALGDQVGTSNAPINAQLGPLQDNGGDTPTMAPLLSPLSPAIDQGNSGGIAFDQRGRPRPNTNNAIASFPFGGDRSDIGAYETGATTVLVTNLNDTGAGSLRSTIAGTALDSVDTVTFASNVIGTITLTNGTLVITNSVNIVGPGAKLVTVNGSNGQRVFQINSGSVLLEGLTITGGSGQSLGAGIYNQGTLVVSKCIINSNVTFRASGAGVANSGNLLIHDSTLCSNVAGGGFVFVGGGGLLNSSNATLINCTIAANSATVTGTGGGIRNIGLLSLSNCTVAGNSVSGSGQNGIGGGIWGSNVTVFSTLVASNSAPVSPDVFGSFISAGYNLISTTNGSTGFGANDLLGSTNNPLDAFLGPLTDAGGPTLTLPLHVGSPAIDTGNSGGLTNDQRGAVRSFDLTTIPNASGGNGTDIGAFELASPLLRIQRQGNSTVLSWPSAYGGFTLQASVDLTVGDNWNAVAGTSSNDSQVFRQTNNSSGPLTFFRLIEN